MALFDASIDIEAESQVLADIFLDDEAAAYILPRLDKEDFQIGVNQQIYDVLKQDFNVGMKLDPITILYQLGHTDEMKRYIWSFCQGCVSTDAYKQHFEVVKTQSVISKLEKQRAEFGDFLGSRHSITDMQQEYTKGLNIFDGCTKDIATKVSDEVDNYVSNLGKKSTVFKCGWNYLDDALRICPGDYVVVGARPSVGKTAWSLQVALNMANDGHTVVFFSCETSKSKLMNRIISNMTKIESKRLAEGNITDEEREVILDFKEEFANVNLYLVESSGWTVSQIQAEAVRLNADVVVIDYIGLVSAGENVAISSYEKMTQISKDIHIMAQSRKIAVIGLSQLNREGKSEPSLENLRDSGQIEQDADAVILLSRVETKDNKVLEERKVNLVKNKEGELTVVYLNFDGRYQQFSYAENSRTEENNAKCSRRQAQASGNRTNCYRKAENDERDTDDSEQ